MMRMPKFEISETEKETFTGRRKELQWLNERLFRRSYSFTPLVISGPAGVGKTTLIRHWLSTERYIGRPIWFTTSDYNVHSLKGFIDDNDHTRLESSLIVVIDGNDPWDEEQYEKVTREVFNYKAVSALLFTTRTAIPLRRAEHLALGPMSESESLELLTKLLHSGREGLLMEAALAAKGYPLAITLLTSLLKNQNAISIAELLNQPLYELSGNLIVPKKDIITVVPQIIVSANHSLAVALQKQPNDLHKLTPRDFEKLLAELLIDMGWEVELTKQTRDGGTDILAYLNTEIGRLLCLVEAKHYRPDRKIGVDLVRTLYGTLCDAQANSAMLVTSSTFTSDAREFQQKHQYQLTLRDYADVVSWISKYGSKQNSISRY